MIFLLSQPHIQKRSESRGVCLISCPLGLMIPGSLIFFIFCYLKDQTNIKPGTHRSRGWNFTDLLWRQDKQWWALASSQPCVFPAKINETQRARSVDVVNGFSTCRRARWLADNDPILGDGVSWEHLPHPGVGEGSREWCSLHVSCSLPRCGKWLL